MKLTVEALCERMGWTREYAEHLLDPRCDCGDTSYEGGWIECGVWLHTNHPDRYDEDGNWIRKPTDTPFDSLLTKTYTRYIENMLGRNADFVKFVDGDD